MNVVYLGFQKAFDEVPHQGFLLKLEAHGIGNGVMIKDTIEQDSLLMWKPVQ